MYSRLSTVAPDLVGVFERQRSAQRAIAIAVSDWIVRNVALVDPRLDAAMAALRESRVGDSPERAALKSLVDELDERAWDTQDRVEAGVATEQEYLDAFALARAASAVWFALDGDALHGALEAAYEAQAARGDLDGVRRSFREVVS